MSFVPILLAIVLLVLAAAFGLHCLILHCDQKRHHVDRLNRLEHAHERPDSPSVQV